MEIEREEVLDWEGYPRVNYGDFGGDLLTDQTGLAYGDDGEFTPGVITVRRDHDPEQVVLLVRGIDSGLDEIPASLRLSLADATALLELYRRAVAGNLGRSHTDGATEEATIGA